MKPGVLVTGRLPASVRARLEQESDLDSYAHAGPMPRDELLARLPGKQGLLCFLNDTVDHAVFDAGAALKVVANTAVGYDNIDVRLARQRNIVVTNTPDVLTDAVADFTVALMLDVTRRVSEGDRLVRQGRWKGWTFDFMLSTELRGKQLGIVGFGRIGQAVAARAAAFGMRVAFTSRRPRASTSAEHVSLETLLASSDLVSLHVPLTAETTHLIDHRALVRMKRSAYLVNTSRGPIVDEAALAWALRERLISGAALDVYEHEPLVHPDLLALENVVLTPHLGSATAETRTAMADLAARNVLAVLRDEPPLTPLPDAATAR